MTLSKKVEKVPAPRLRESLKKDVYSIFGKMHQKKDMKKLSLALQYQ